MKIAALVILCVVAVSAYPKKHYDVVCPSMVTDDIMSPFIVGGVEAKQGEFPWMVSIRDAYGHFCGGSLIASDVVLTAAHCTPDIDENTEFHIGGHDLTVTGDKEVTRYSKKTVVHKGYGSYGSSLDIALVHLNKAVELNDRVNTICLPPTGTNTTGMTTVAGWGTTQFFGSGSDVLMKVDVPTMTDDVCRYGTKYKPSDIYDSMICAGYHAGGKDSCQGDSGGPLMKKLEDGSYYQAGIVSWGSGCAWKDYPGVYTEVSYFTEWVQKQLKKFA